ncbi:sugar phosphate isomerase/epimerase family protein [Plantactinospora solaniradicis]|uniref:Sugar phosphate isomerase/epimerase family protein n=1 Tax=Plantactinospora solaniradicis TaxID=1723736 RepID=A0ABW1K3U6_9ACTN
MPTADSGWSLAAAMLPFPAELRPGVPVQDAPAQTWRDTLAEVAAEGFTEVDLTDSWVRAGDLSPARLTELDEAVRAAGLRAEAISVIRRSVIDPVAGLENLDYSHRSIDAAAALGCSVLSVGLHRPLTARQREVLWFWTVDGPRDAGDPETRRLAASRLRELGQHAAEVGVALSLEMYEDTLLGTADSAVRLVEEIGHPNVGLNPDLGNLVRLHRPIEPIEVMLDKCLPLTNYWHVKNYHRFEDGTTGTVLSTPTSMELGVINYRRAVRSAVAYGFTGAFCLEQYGGDGLGVMSTNRRYLTSILPPKEAP